MLHVSVGSAIFLALAIRAVNNCPVERKVDDVEMRESAPLAGCV